MQKKLGEKSKGEKKNRRNKEKLQIKKLKGQRKNRNQKETFSYPLIPDAIWQQGAIFDFPSLMCKFEH